jgi:hypothetical protein
MLKSQDIFSQWTFCRSSAHFNSCELFIANLWRQNSHSQEVWTGLPFISVRFVWWQHSIQNTGRMTINSWMDVHQYTLHLVSLFTVKLGLHFSQYLAESKPSSRSLQSAAYKSFSLTAPGLWNSGITSPSPYPPQFRCLFQRKHWNINFFLNNCFL